MAPSFQHHLKNLLFAGLAVLLLIRFSGFLPDIKKRFENFIQAKGNYDLLRTQYQVFSHIGEISPGEKPITSGGPWKATFALPETASVEILPKHWTMPRIMARYLLFPRPVTENAPYVLDLYPGSNVPTGANAKQLPSGAALYAIDGAGFANLPTKNVPHWTSAALTVLISSLMYLGLGFFLCARLQIDFRTGGLVWFASNCYLAGFFMLNAALCLFLMARVPLTRAYVLLLCTLMAIVMQIIWKKDIKNMLDDLREACRHRQGFTMECGYSLMTSLLIGALALSIAISPVMDWDGMLHWAYQAKLFFQHQGFAGAYPDLNYYPPLWPAAMATQFILAGSTYDAPLSWLVAFVFLVFIAQFSGCLKILGASAKEILAALFFYLAFYFHLSSPFYWTYAETILGALLLGFVGQLCLWIRNRNEISCLVLAALFAAAMGVIKLEGSIFVCAVILAAIFSWRKELSGREIGLLVSAALLPAVLMGVWIGWVKLNGLLIPISHAEEALDGTKIKYFISLLWRKFQGFNWTHAGFIAIAASALLFKPGKMEPATKFLAVAFMALSLFSIFAVLGVYTDRLPEQLERVSPRLFAHAALLLVLCWGSLLSRSR